MDTKKNLMSRSIVTLVFLMFTYSASFGQSLKPMPESEYVAFLDTAAALMKANYEKINTWQGEFSIQEDNDYYGEQCRSFNIDANDPAARSDAIRRSISILQEFAIDIKNNKLYCSKSMPEYKFKALDLDRDIVLERLYTPMVSIVTSDAYLSFKPNLNYSYGGRKVNGKWAGKKAFRFPLEKAKNEQWGNVRDPRKYFSEGHRMIWEDLERLRNHIANPSPDIPEGKAPQISIMTEGTKAYIKTRFYRSEDCNGCNPNLEFVNINMILDSSVQYNLIHREALDTNNEILQTLDITYESLDGICVPKTVHYVTFRSSDLNKSFDSKITFTKSILNVPIVAETFGIENLKLSHGDMFEDRIADKQYVFRNDELVEVQPQQQ